MSANIVPIRTIGVLRLSLTGAIASALVLILCWLGTFVPFSSPTHAFIGLFTSAEVNSVAALIEGTVWAFLFGGLSATMLAAIYNWLSPLEQR